ncbi:MULTISPECIES: hypothetical protein [unclassified Duganella]|uniref:hypothetical protein n=1 Tax=unclassified Duganella TaxID=2636909 RepID=UPI001E37113B|nr:MULTISPECIES: hypothetical protein [unclassified Duganella]
MQPLGFLHFGTQFSLKCAIPVDGNLAPRYSESYFWPEGKAMVISADAVDQVQRVRALEREVALLRTTLASMPAAGSNQEWKDEVVRLLSEVVLFRLSLDQETVLSSFKNK